MLPMSPQRADSLVQLPGRCRVALHGCPLHISLKVPCQLKALTQLKNNALPILPRVVRRQTNLCLTIRSVWHKATRASKLKMRLTFWDPSSSPAKGFQTPQLRGAWMSVGAASSPGQNSALECCPHWGGVVLFSSLCSSQAVTAI